MRAPITTLEQLDALDKTEIVDGYQDGFSGEPEPGNNRSLSYWHGWRNGHNDKAGKVDTAQLELARKVAARNKAKANPF